MKVGVIGCGAMGKVLEEEINRSDDFESVGPINPRTGDGLEGSDAELLIDFSNPANLEIISAYCSSKNCPAVIATTGYTPEQETRIRELSTAVPVVYAANFSFGVAVMRRVLAEISPVLRDNFDMEIVEMHHNKKLDSPSGTAKMLAAAMDPQQECERICGRRGNAKRSKNEIGIHSIRGGSAPGEHSAIYAGEDEILKITHRAGSKRIFARGALIAAAFASNSKPGLYNMEDVLFADRCTSGKKI